MCCLAGAHWTKTPEQAGKIFKLIARAIKTVLPTSVVVFRSNVMGHDGCHKFSKPSAVAQGTQYNWRDFGAYNSAVIEAFEAEGVANFFMMDLSMYEQRGDGHVTYGDCLHYCTPGPPDLWNQQILFHILAQVAAADGVHPLATPADYQVAAAKVADAHLTSSPHPINNEIQPQRRDEARQHPLLDQALLSSWTSGVLPQVTGLKALRTVLKDGLLLGSKQRQCGGSLLTRFLDIDRPLRIGVVGGSISAGGGAEAGDSLYMDVFAGWLREIGSLNVTVFNAAVGGSTTALSFYEIETRLPPNLDLLIWEHGLNDAATWFNKPSTRQSWGMAFLQRALWLYPQTVLLFMHIVADDPSGNNRLGNSDTELHAFLQQAAETHDVMSVTTRQLTPATLNHTVGINVPSSYTMPSGHQGAFGHGLFGALVAQAFHDNLRALAKRSLPS